MGHCQLDLFKDTEKERKKSWPFLEYQIIFVSENCCDLKILFNAFISNRKSRDWKTEKRNNGIQFLMGCSFFSFCLSFVPSFSFLLYKQESVPSPVQQFCVLCQKDLMKGKLAKLYWALKWSKVEPPKIVFGCLKKILFGSNKSMKF